jgi:PAS domain S-box-containing protein
MAIPRSREIISKSQFNILEILNHTSIQLLDAKEEAEIYRIVAQASKLILPGAFFVVTKLQADDMNFRMIESAGFDKFISTISKILGKDPFTIDFPFKDLTEQQFEAYEGRKIYHFKGGIFDLANGALSKTFCKTVEVLLGITEVCAMSFYVEKKYYGGITLFIPGALVRSGKMNNEVEFAIETISNMASGVIQKLRDRQDLIVSKEKIEIEQFNYNRLVSQLTDIVWKAKIDGTEVVDLNNSFEKYYGIPASSFNTEPETWVNVVHPDDRHIAAESATELYKTGNTTVEYRILRPDGRIIWLHDRKSILFDNNGQALEIGGVASDITERKLLTEELKIKNYALDNSPTATAFADFQEKLFYVNKAYMKLYGYEDQNEIIGRHLSEFSTSEILVEKVLETIKKGQIFSGEGIVQSKDGSTIPVILSATTVKHDNKPICLMAMFVDITRQKEIEKSLKEQSNYLAEVNATKDKFFSIIAHDLRGPLGGFVNLTKIMVEDFNELSPNKMMNFMTSLRKSSEKLYNLLENLLEWSRLQRGMISFEPREIALHTQLKDFLQIVQEAAISKTITILTNVPDDLLIYGDERMLEATMRNLLTNSIKFTPQGGIITITAYPTLNHSVIVSVKDTGMGMSKDLMNKLFRIEQSSGRPGTDGESSSGLGLLLCKEFIECHQGRIWVESEVDVGSTFHFEIPDKK